MSGQFLGRLLLDISQDYSTATWSDISFPTHRLPSSLSFFPSLRDGYHLVKAPLLRMEVATLILVVKAQSLSIQEFLSGIIKTRNLSRTDMQDAHAQPAISPAQVAYVQPPSPGVTDRQVCLQQTSCPSPKAETAQQGGRWWERQ